MIIPTVRAAVLLVLASPVAVLIAAVTPGAWLVAPVFALLLLVLVIADALAAGRMTEVRLTAPGDVEVGANAEIAVEADFAGGRRGQIDAALSADARLLPGGRDTVRLSSDNPAESHGTLLITPTRRGTGSIDRLWVRWTGPLGLGARQIVRVQDTPVRIRPNVAQVRSPALQTFLRDAQFGLIARRARGEGSEFEALAEYRPGIDRRRIDWKSSARHRHLYAKEFETERNSQIVFAFDCGRAMCEPIGGVARIDRAVSAALATAYVALKGGDRVAMFGFAARPAPLTPFVAGTRGFSRLQAAAATFDYAAQEPNFTLALATLAQHLRRRSLVVVFSDFTDPTSAELMIDSVGRLVSRHLVLFVTMADEELEDIAQAAPGSLQTLAMAVTADALLKQRALVIARLRQIGVDVIAARHAAIGTRLIDAYLAIKQAGAIG